MQVTDISHRERRRHTRASIGLPVRVHFAGRTVPVTVELRDVSLSGCYFTGVTATPDQRLAFGFVLPEKRVCVANGRVVRADRNGFAVELDRSNDGFTDFLNGLSGPIMAISAA